MLLDSNLSFDRHVSSICKTAFSHLKNISKLRPMLSMSNAEILINAFMTSRLDYCNALLGGCSACLINKLQMVQMQQLEFLLEPVSMTTLARFCQHCTGSAGGRSFSYLAPKLWNNLPNTVREADTLCQFKSRLKSHLFNLAYNNTLIHF